MQKVKVKRALVWFRNDLRILDNPALSAAIENAEEIIPVYVFSRSLIEGSQHGSRRMDSRRLGFILESLEDLSKNLGGRLTVQKGDPTTILSQLVSEYRVDAVYANREVSPYEITDENKLRQKISPQVQLHLFEANGLYSLSELPFSLEELPDVFTPFRKLCEKKTAVGKELPRPTQINIAKVVEKRAIPSLSDLGFEEPHSPKDPVLKFAGGEKAAFNRLNHYFFESRSLQSYKETRNGLLGADYSSKFSPWLAHGCISPRTIYHQVRKYEKEIKKNNSTYWMIFELMWREYFRWVALKYGPRLYQQKGIKEVPFRGELNPAFLEAWKNGLTGVPFVDANMKELNQTGFMSNRGRQNVASYFVNELNLDWRYGAAYFEEKLIDYDCASNWGNWAYIAGVGNDPVEKRWFNVFGQAQRYDKDASYVKSRLPKLKDLDPDQAHQPWILSQEKLEEYNLINTVYTNPVMLPQRPV